MKMLMIENEGEVDVLAFTLMGASSKRTQDGKIGFFGSGNKYAIANMLRRKIDFKIFSGEQEIKVFTKPVLYREKTYEKVMFEYQGEVSETSITTEMGPKWEPWYVVRELYCNAVDEGEAQVVVTNLSDLAHGLPGKTRIYVQLTEELEHVINHWNGYFTQNRIDLLEELPAAEASLFDNLSGVKIYRKFDDKFRIYRKGILVHVSDQPSVFDYDLEDAEINEERLLMNHYHSTRRIGKAISFGGSPKLLFKALQGMDAAARAGGSVAESDMSLEYFIEKNKERWKKSIEGLTVINNTRKDVYSEEAKAVNSLLVPSAIAHALSNEMEEINVLGVPKKGLKNSFREVHPTVEQNQTLIKAFEFLVTAGFNFGDIKIITVEFDEYSVAGSADVAGNRILIGKAAFDKGLKFLVTTLMEEHAHIVSRFNDETRSFQNYLIDQWLVSIEERLDIRL